MPTTWQIPTVEILNLRIIDEMDGKWAVEFTALSFPEQGRCHASTVGNGCIWKNTLPRKI
jgi:hypothetical protein